MLMGFYTWYSIVKEENAPVKGGKNPDGTQRYHCPHCGRLWWEAKFVPKRCDCGVNLKDVE